uniref:FBD domain-containing protein n=1 Tax=Haemonchus contortus TaxID=6289 RepID=A0A7I4XSR2_HAECO
MYPSVVQLADSHEVLSPCFATLRLRYTHLKTISIVNCYSPHSPADKVELDAFYDKLKEITHNESPLYNLLLEISALGSARYKRRSSGLESSEWGTGTRTETVWLYSSPRLDSSIDILSSRRRNIAAGHVKRYNSR